MKMLFTKRTKPIKLIRHVWTKHEFQSDWHKKEMISCLMANRSKNKPEIAAETCGNGALNVKSFQLSSFIEQFAIIWHTVIYPQRKNGNKLNLFGHSIETQMNTKLWNRFFYFFYSFSFFVNNHKWTFILAFWSL